MSGTILKFPAPSRARLRPRAAPPPLRGGDLESHLVEAQAVARLGSWETDRATGVTMVSPEMRRMLGWRARERADLLRLLEQVHPDDRTRVARWLGRSASAPPSASGCVFRIQRSDGSFGTFLGRCELRAARNGRPPRECGTLQDVTEWRAVPVQP